MNKGKSVLVARAGVIAALYTVITIVVGIFGLASGAIQVRLSEALTVLPIFTPAAIPGLFIGCILSNLITGCAFWDVIFGSIATLIGAVGTYMLKDKGWICILPPIVSNTIIVPFVLRLVYGVPDSILFLMLTVGIGEVISCGIFGLILKNVLKKHEDTIFKR